MGYAEQRGKLWRARWKLPSGKLDGMSGFLTQKAARNYANDQEAKIRAGNYVDPRAGQILVNTWIDTWFRSLDLEESTLENYRFLLETCVRPFFAERTLASLSAEEINEWERDLVKVYDYSKATAKAARSRLGTALAAAVPSRIPTNPAARPRASGKRADRRVQRVLQKRRAYATPLEIVLIAERLGIMAGPAVFVQTVFAGFTGARWSEILGTAPDCVRGAELDLDWKLYELNGHFYRGRPKDGSIRTIDVPPFLQSLLQRHLEDEATTTRCTCSEDAPEPYCSGGQYVFLGPDGGHPRRSTFSRRFLRPAADGAYPGQRGKPATPVVASLAASWPGLPLPASGSFRGFQPGQARASGVNSRSTRAALVEYGVAQGTSVEELAGLTREQLLDRFVRSAYVSRDSALVSWLPIMRGLTMHGFRHGHETMMAEDRIAEALRDERMGHIGDGTMRAHYTHVTDPMRGELLEALQRRWETALMERVELERHWGGVMPAGSALPLLEELLQPFRDAAVSKIGSHFAPKIGQRRERKRPIPVRIGL
ncbi:MULTISPECIES: hypothetical protein [Streptosporangiaceae]|uniref:hypothetical protein n=1 Tax=Streptosporangiaceae TaxID=2004 RepID=UPI0033D48F01